MSSKENLITVNPAVKQKGFKNKNFKVVELTNDCNAVQKRINGLLKTKYYNELSEKNKNIIEKYLKSYKQLKLGKKLKEDHCILKNHELVEFKNVSEHKIFHYLVYRYKYNIYPKFKIIDDYPPCVQIEPVSVCNYRCVFCYQSDKTFTAKKSGHMGYMGLGVFKNVIDQIDGNVEAVTLASRGEPTLNKELPNMIKYMQGKFLAVKINTNASKLTDELIHIILSSDIQTLCLSIDASDKEMYEKLRVNGKYEIILGHVKNLRRIKEKDYPNSKLTTRISGVKVNKNQNIDDMVDIWKPYADIVAFTNYTPWESSYQNPENNITEPCTELWRRMFVWWDGKVNPCDYDYKSVLSKWNSNKMGISKIWNSDYYNYLREMHLSKRRRDIEPCKKCISV